MNIQAIILMSISISGIYASKGGGVIFIPSDITLLVVFAVNVDCSIAFEFILLFRILITNLKTSSIMNKSNPIIIYAPDEKGRVQLTNGNKRHHYVLTCNFSLQEQRTFVDRLQALVHVETFSNIATQRMSLEMNAYSRVTKRPMSKVNVMTMISGLLGIHYKM